MSKQPLACGRMGARRYFTVIANKSKLIITRRRGKVWYFTGGPTTPSGTPRILCLRWYGYKLVHENYSIYARQLPGSH